MTAVGDITLTKMREATEALVVRARAGDQNAIAMIVRVREAAPQSRRAAVAYDLLRDYIQRNPIGKIASFAGEKLKLGLGPGPAMRDIRDSVHTKTWPYAAKDLVKGIERLPTNLDDYSRAACLVADGLPVDVMMIKCVLPYLRGDAVLLEGKPATLGEVHRAGKRIASEWVVEKGPKGDLRAASNGLDIGFRVGDTVVPSLQSFIRCLHYATNAAWVQKYAEKFSGPARQPIRVGYVLGLARTIQGVTKNEAPIAGLSDLAAWELGEE